MKHLMAAVCATGVALLVIANGAPAQHPYPTRAVRFIVPFPPGGSTDPMARMAGGKLAERLGQPVVIENRPGASGIVGTEVVAKAPRDGYTILLGSSPFAINAALGRKLPYDPLKDFDPVASIARSRQLMVVHPSIPADSLRDFIVLARSKPAQFNYSTSGTGNLNHLAGELFNMMAKVRLVHVPYKGGGPAIVDVLGGQIALTFQVPISVIPHVASGKLKPLAITGESRLATLPQIPTFAEAGMPGYDLSGWTGILAPGGTPLAIVERISSEMGRILALPEIADSLVKQGMEPFASTPAQFTAKINADIAKFGAIIKTAGIKLD